MLLILRAADPLHSIAVTHDDRMILGTSSGSILICRVSHDEESIECISTLKGHTDIVNCLVIHETNFLLSASSDASIRYWDLRSDTCLAVLTGHAGPVYSLSIIPGGLVYP
jgi:WD40 repeat protein